MRALQRALKISVWMVGRTHPSVASARIWRVAKTGRRVVVVAKFLRSWGWMASACCKLSRWNLDSADHSLVCSQDCWAHRQRQWTACPRCQLPAMPQTMAIRGSTSWSGRKVIGPSGRGTSLGAWSQRPPGPNAVPQAAGDPHMVVVAVFLYDQAARNEGAALRGVPRATFAAYLATISRRVLPISGPLFFFFLQGHWTAGCGGILPSTAVRPLPGVRRLARVGVWSVGQWVWVSS